MLPGGWRDRLVLISGENTRFVRGWRLDVHDLAIARYAAGREKALSFTEAPIRLGMVDKRTLLARLERTPIDSSLRELTWRRIERQFAAV
jgi:hypothetical protein